MDENNKRIEELLADIPLLDCWVAHLYREWWIEANSDEFQRTLIPLFETFKQEHEELASLMRTSGSDVIKQKIEERYKKLGR